MNFLILFLVAVVVSSIGFKKFVWFISLGYGFSIAAIGIGLIALFAKQLNTVSLVMSILFVVYGCRLGFYLLIRERKSASYQSTMKNDIKDGSSSSFFEKLMVWLVCALLYVCEASPVLFRLQNRDGIDTMAIIGCCLMVCGIVLESFSDYTKNKFKKQNPKRFCDVGVFRIVRCPNYLGEVFTWTGVFLSGVTIYKGVWQWGAAIFGWACIVYIMFGGARRLEIRQNKNYGNDPEYQEYVKKVPILLPLVPLYSVADYKWLVG